MTPRTLMNLLRDKNYLSITSGVPSSRDVWHAKWQNIDISKKAFKWLDHELIIRTYAISFTNLWLKRPHIRNYWSLWVRMSEKMTSWEKSIKRNRRGCVNFESSLRIADRWKNLLAIMSRRMRLIRPRCNCWCNPRMRWRGKNLSLPTSNNSNRS